VAVQIQDVARRAGVSVSTVSNVLNGRMDRMRPGTLKRVDEAIRALNYKPNQVARLLKTGRAPILGLLVPSIANPFFGSLAREIDERAQKLGYRLVLGNTARETDKERGFLESLVGFGVRGVITTSSMVEQDHYAALIEHGLSIVSFDRKSGPDAKLPVDYVSIDNVEAGRVATTHLIEHGHRAICYATAPAKTLSRVDRREGYVAAMKRAKLSTEVRVFEASAETAFGDSEMSEVGRIVANEVAKQTPRPTAVVTMNDMVAIGMIARLHDLGFRVPSDISIVGIDDLYLDSLISPAITSVRQPLPDIAQAMLERLIARLENPTAPPTELVFQPKLVVRDSVRTLETSKGKPAKLRRRTP
jgi:DNA-binding LacI/PurR family transcriptional regulator